MTLNEWTIVDYLHKGPWWKNHGEHVLWSCLSLSEISHTTTLIHEGILVLNICLMLPMITATMNGFDSSLVNGLQIIPSWQDYYKNPSGKILGVFHVLLVSPPHPTSPSTTELLRFLGLINCGQGAHLVRVRVCGERLWKCSYDPTSSSESFRLVCGWYLMDCVSRSGSLTHTVFGLGYAVYPHGL